MLIINLTYIKKLSDKMSTMDELIVEKSEGERKQVS